MTTQTSRPPTAARCPFCSTDEILVVLYESATIRVFPDVRPIVPGHVLVTPTAHWASVEDLEPVDYWRLRVVQQEAARRVRRAWGGVASAYEHGRSAICRFHAADRGDTHAHVHVLPARIDVLAGSGTEIQRAERPPAAELRGEERYVYQHVHGDAERWGWRPVAVPRHFLRVGLQAGLHAEGRSFVALDAPVTEHMANIEETARAYRAQADASCTTVVLRASSEAEGSRHAAALAEACGAAVADTSLLYRLLVQEQPEGDPARRLRQLAEVEARFELGELGWVRSRAGRVALARCGDELHGLVDPRLDAAARSLAEQLGSSPVVRRLVSHHAEPGGRVVIADGRAGAATGDVLELATSLDDAEPTVIATGDLSPEQVRLVLLEGLAARTDGKVGA